MSRIAETCSASCCDAHACIVRPPPLQTAATHRGGRAGGPGALGAECSCAYGVLPRAPAPAPSPSCNCIAPALIWRAHREFPSCPQNQEHRMVGRLPGSFISPRRPHLRTFLCLPAVDRSDEFPALRSAASMPRGRACCSRQRPTFAWIFSNRGLARAVCPGQLHGAAR